MVRRQPVMVWRQLWWSAGNRWWFGGNSDGPEVTLMVRRQLWWYRGNFDGPEAIRDGTEATLMVWRFQRQHIIVRRHSPMIKINFNDTHFDSRKMERESTLLWTPEFHLLSLPIISNSCILWVFLHFASQFLPFLINIHPTPTLITKSPENAAS